MAANKGKGRRKGKRAASSASAHDTQRMTERKPKPKADTMRGGFKPSWEEDAPQ